MRDIFAVVFALVSLSAMAQSLEDVTDKKLLPPTPQTIHHTPSLQSVNFAVTPGTCSLKRFTLTTFDLEYRNVFQKIPSSRQSLIGATTDTTDPSCLKDYAVVQFIKGCIYSELTNKVTGKVERTFNGADSRGVVLDEFKFPVWTLDSIDADPIYNSFSGEGANESRRLDWQQFTKRPLNLKNDRASFLEDFKTFFDSKNFAFSMYAKGRVFSQTFISDIPTGSNYMPEQYNNVDEVEVSSVEFRTCIYNIKDVPMTGDPASFTEEGKEGGPIKCFSWSDKSKFNAQTKRFERTEEMDPFCLQ